MSAEAAQNAGPERVAAQAAAIAAAQSAALTATPPETLDADRTREIVEQADQAYQALLNRLEKAAAHVLRTVTALNAMIEAHEHARAGERKAASLAVPVVPAPAPEKAEAKSTRGHDPLSGISLAGQQLLGALNGLETELTQEYPISRNPALRQTPLYERWRKLRIACEGFLRTNAVAWASAKDIISEHTNPGT
ncbi:hypothetical protein [Streptomyces sp. NPDC055085]